jgi:hypothetical protein
LYCCCFCLYTDCLVWLKISLKIGYSAWKVQITHSPNITGVRPGTGTYKSSDNTSTKHNGSKTRNWTLQKFRQHIHQT